MARPIHEKSELPTFNIVLTYREHQLIEALVSSGRYQNANEVLRDGFHSPLGQHHLYAQEAGARLSRSASARRRSESSNAINER
jgi:Arc/MetJ-type ribon-helix-helix transcriptional regulator